MGSNSDLFHVDFKGSIGLALRTCSWTQLFVLLLAEGSQDETTFHAVVLDHVELWEDSSAAGHHTVGTSQLVQVKLSTHKEHKVLQ